MALSTSAGPAQSTPEEPHNCRLWALIGHDYPDTLLREHLQTGSIANLRQLGAANYDGWGFAYTPGERLGLPISGLLYRRGGPRANHPHEPEYDRTVAELRALRPTAIVGHVRRGTSGHWGIPDPHPFLHPQPSERAMAFAHNGSVNELAMLALLGDYTDTHPLEYTVGLPGSGPIDSELLFLYLLKYKDEHPELASFSEAIPPAIGEVMRATGSHSLNVTMTQGDTLYAVSAFGLSYYPLAGRGDPPSPYWVVASQIVGSGAAGWGTIPSGMLGVFAPEAAPRFVPLDVPRGRSAPAAGASATPSSTAQAAPSRSAAAAGGPEDHDGRFWALVGGGYPASMIQDHLSHGAIQNLKALGAANPDGWGLGYVPPSPAAALLTDPIVRRGGPRAGHPHAPFYDRTVNELRLLGPRAAIGHVRRGTSGHLGIPGPHPFLHRHPRDGRGLLFAHAGSLDALALGLRLGTDYLATHPPDYGSSTSLLDLNHIDAELYFLYLLKQIEERPDLPFAEALLEAVRAVSRDDEVTDMDPRLNFAMTDGATLYVLNFYGQGNANAVCYYPPLPPSGGAASPFWVAASESLGTVSGWAALPPQTLAVFVPGEAPRLLPVEEPVEPRFSFAWIEVTALADDDGDGYASRFQVCADPNADQGSWSVSMTLFVSPAGEDAWRQPLSTRYKTITGAGPDTLCLTRYAVPDTLGPTEWDLRITLTEGSSGDTVLVATPLTHPEGGLGGLKVEGVLRDQPSAGPSEIRFRRVDVTSAVDLDQDGYARSFTLEWEAGLIAAGGSAARPAPGPDSVLVRVYALALAGGEETTAGVSGEHWIRAAEEDSIALPITVPAGLPARAWDLRLDLFVVGPDTLAAVAGPGEFAALAGILVEGALFDDPSSPDTLGLIGLLPNPSGAPVIVRLSIPPGGASASLEVRDVTGRRVRAGRPVTLAHGPREISWDGRDDRGRRLPAGIYLCTIRLGEREYTRRVALMR